MAGLPLRPWDRPVDQEARDQFYENYMDEPPRKRTCLESQHDNTPADLVSYCPQTEESELLIPTCMEVDALLEEQFDFDHGSHSATENSAPDDADREIICCGTVR